MMFDYQNSESKKEILGALVTFLYRRTLINPEDYAGAGDSLKGDRNTARSHLKDAKILLSAVNRRTWITEGEILKHAHGRLTYDPTFRRWDYVVGQFFGTEYRGAVCSLLAGVLLGAYCDTGISREETRQRLKRELGRSVVNRWL